MKNKDKVWGEAFVKAAQNKGYIVKKPTSSEYNRYINFILSGKGADGKPQEVKLSYKPLKKTSNKNWIWVEIKNSNGKPGWLYGDSDFIVFELEDEFLFVVRKDLLEHVNSSINFSLPLVQNTWEAKYKIFQRKGKLDQISQIKLKNIYDIKGNYKWNKK